MSAAQPTGSISQYSRRSRLSLHVPAKHGVDRRLVTPSLFAEKRQYVRIESQSDLLFQPRPDDRMLEEFGT